MRPLSPLSVFGPDFSRLLALRRGAVQAARGGSGDEAREKYERAVEASERLVEERAARLRPASIDPELPIAAHQERLIEAIRAHQVTIVCGETGSGKSTQLPRLCMAAGRGARGWIGHTQPRRIAARSVAARITEELGPGGEELVGYTVRHGTRTPSSAIIKLMTDGILLAEITRDRLLHRYDTILIDEAHERSLNIDFLLGYLRRILPRRPDLRVIVTSATIDTARFSEHFGGAPVIDIPGRAYPVDIRYQPFADEPDETSPEAQAALSGAVRTCLQANTADEPGDILVFLSGEREIRDTTQTLEGLQLKATEIVPLYARLSLDDQAKIFKPHKGRRIVLATNVAETALTVPGIRFVIDTGLARISRYAARSGVQRLPIEPISRASAEQRAGRCGRIGPGICIRLYDEASFTAREAWTPPEILRTNLASVILRMTALQLGRPEDFPFIEPPRRMMIRDGYATLHELGALDSEHAITPLGRAIADLPVDPRLAVMLAAAAEEDAITELLVIVSALSVQDPRDRPLDRRDAADEAHARFAAEKSDFLTWLRIWYAYDEKRRSLGRSALRTWCREHFLSPARMREWFELHSQLERLMRERHAHLNDHAAGPAAIHRCVLRGLLSHVGQRGDRFEYRSAGGSTFVIHPASGLFRKTPQWVVAAEIVETRRRYARCVAQIQPEWVESAGRHLLERSWTNPVWDARRGRVLAEEKVTMLGLEVVARRKVDYGRIHPEIAREIFIQQALVEGAIGREPPPFLAHNLALAQEIRTIEAKCRRRDVLVDPAKQFAFYDARLPRRLCSRSRLERFLLDHERKEPQALYMTRADLAMRDDFDAHETAFPDFLLVDGHPLPLTYALDPAAEHDGVTLRIPATMLPRLNGERVEWLAPGMLREKITELIRTLPRGQRSAFVPAPDTAERVLTMLPFGEGDLCTVLARALHTIAGVGVRAQDFSLSSLPPHLRMRMEVAGADEKTLASGRDLPALRQLLEAQVRSAVADLAHEQLPEGRFTDWIFPDLPPVVTRTEAGLPVEAYPAILDADDGVILTLLPHAADADRRTRGGLRRLCLLRTEAELHEQLPLVPHMHAITELAGALGAQDSSAASLAEQLRVLIVDQAFLRGRLPIRTRAAFEAALADGQQDLWRSACSAAEFVHRILSLWQRTARRLTALTAPIYEPITRDAARHLHELTHPGFLIDTPAELLDRLPAWIAGIDYRLSALGAGGLQRDDKYSSLLRTRRQQLDDERARRGVAHHADPDIIAAWGMLEDLGLTLFAPDLAGTHRVSLRHVDDVLAELGR